MIWKEAINTSVYTHTQTYMPAYLKTNTPEGIVLTQINHMMIFKVDREVICENHCPKSFFDLSSKFNIFP